VHFPRYKTNLLRVTRALVVNAVLLLGDLWRDYRLISRLSVILPLVIGVPSAGHATRFLCITAIREHFVRIIKPMLLERRREISAVLTAVKFIRSAVHRKNFLNMFILLPLHVSAHVGHLQAEYTTISGSYFRYNLSVVLHSPCWPSSGGIHNYFWK
jgi:hypothetical protein